MSINSHATETQATDGLSTMSVTTEVTDGDANAVTAEQSVTITRENTTEQVAQNNETSVELKPQAVPIVEAPAPKGMFEVKQETQKAKLVPKPIAVAKVIDIPAVTTASNDPSDSNYPILRVTQDKSELVKLNQDAASVIVGNPAHISVLLDTPDTLVVVPRAPGASHFTVMGKDGSVLMQRHVIVGAAKEQYVRIRRSCGAGDNNCQATSVYFCPDMCHEVQENSGSGRRR